MRWAPRWWARRGGHGEVSTVMVGTAMGLARSGEGVGLVILLNGEPHEPEPATSVAALIESLGLGERARGVAVAVDGEVVPRAAWDSYVVADGARVEVLTAMQGG